VITRTFHTPGGSASLGLDPGCFLVGVYVARRGGSLHLDLAVGPLRASVAFKLS